MPLDGPQFGMRDDGTPFPVPALVLVDQGRGALWGLVAGDALGRKPGATTGVAEQACAVAESLMAHGGYEPDDVAQRAGWSERPRGVASLVRAVPIALFYANDEDLRYSVTLAECDEPGDDRTPVLAAAALSGALAAVVFEHDVTATEMIVAAIASLDALSLRLIDADPELRTAVKAANDALRLDLGLALEAELALEPSSATGFALRVALWHLFHDTAPEDAIQDALAVPGMGSAEAAVAGALIGALTGEAALSDGLKVAARALVQPGQAPTIERLLPFIDPGPLTPG